MSQHDVHTLTGAYAADALPPDERRSFEAHLETCATCRQEAAELVATAARLGSAAATTAPSGLRTRVLDEARRTRQVSPLLADLRASASRRAWYQQPLGVAASLLLVVALGLGALATTEIRRADNAEHRADAISQLVTAPGRHTATDQVSTGGSGTVVAADGRALFRATGLTGLARDHTYQLWVIRSGAARSAGVLGRAASGTLQQLVDDVRPGDRIGLTVEPDGGSKAPTTDPLVELPVSS